MSPKRKPKRRRRWRLTRQFDETRLGYYLKHAAPLEYSLILDVSGDSAPNVDVIEAIVYASINPYFKTVKFHNALLEYRKYGMHPPRPAKPTVLKELYFIRYRRDLARNFKNYE